jgi:hypothetical protein
MMLFVVFQKKISMDYSIEKILWSQLNFPSLKYKEYTQQGDIG